MSLSPVEVNLQAKKIAVHIHGSGRGSGVIISRQSKAVIEQASGELDREVKKLTDAQAD